MSTKEVIGYLSYLAVKKNVAASTQNQALNAIVFLFKEVLEKDVGDLNQTLWAKKSNFLPVVLSVNQVREILKNLKGVQHTIGCLLYGTGMRLTEALRLRVKDIDFERNMILVRDAKGQKDRVVPLPRSLRDSLVRQLDTTKKYHEIDLKEGFGKVSLPYALQKKYPNADKAWIWQPSHKWDEPRHLSVF